MDWKEHIAIDADICCGKPRLKELRITVEFVLEAVAAGTTIQEMLEEYPGMRPEHIQAAFDYTASLLREKKLERAAS
ncbi:MAG: DUF433 domain-containing protein [Planctomycetota bacterium]